MAFQKSEEPMNEASNARPHSLNIPIYTCVHACARNRNQIQELNSVEKKMFKIRCLFLHFLYYLLKSYGISNWKKVQSPLQATGLKRHGHCLWSLDHEASEMTEAWISFQNLQLLHPPRNSILEEGPRHLLYLSWHGSAQDVNCP